ncbi:XRE family transcriptional regulator [Pelagibius sp. CAU 1746]|uniref:helix-turn-helix domain-containing protein n=1 Tax=Pelagibius sp. CAU 1746 TaxID=3140370 RepID=UPI00325B797F
MALRRKSAGESEALLPGGKLGRDLRALRKTRGLTLTELAVKVGRSVGFLSQVERGLSELGIDDLRALAAALEAPMSWFLVREDAPEEERGHVVRAAGRRRIGSAETGLTEELLSPDLGGGFEVLRSVFAPGAERRQVITRDTEETGYLVAGELELWIGGRHFHLKAGDSFRTEREPTRWRNPGKAPCEVIWVISPPVY